jgi:hypothetical protein
MLSEDASRELHGMIWGSRDETMSSALWRRRRHWRWGLVRLWVDWLAVAEHSEPWGHCQRAYETHRQRVLAAMPQDDRARYAGL